MAHKRGQRVRRIGILNRAFDEGSGEVHYVDDRGCTTLIVVAALGDLDQAYLEEIPAPRCSAGTAVLIAMGYRREATA